MLETFLLASTVGLLFDSWIGFFVIIGLQLVNLWACKEMKDFSGLPGGEAFHHKLVLWWTKLDLLVNWLSKGNRWSYTYSGLARICFQHVGARTGKRFVTPVRTYLLDDYAKAGLVGNPMILLTSNHGTKKLPGWYFNLKKMQGRGEQAIYNFGHTVYVSDIEIVEDEETLSKLVPQMRKQFPEYVGYENAAKRHNRPLHVVLLKPKGMSSWQDARHKFGDDMLRPPVPAVVEQIEKSFDTIAASVRPSRSESS